MTASSVRTEAEFIMERKLNVYSQPFRSFSLKNISIISKKQPSSFITGCDVSDSKKNQV